MPDRDEPRTPDQLRNAIRATPADYATIHTPRPESDRPLTVTFPAIVATAVGAMGLFCCGAVNAVQGMAELTRPELVQGFQPNPAVAQYKVAMSAAYVVLCGSLMAAGFGAMSLRNWARVLGLVTSALLILVGITELIAELTWLVSYRIQAAEAMLAATKPTTQPAIDINRLKQVGPYIPVGMFVFQLIAPLLILTLWTRSSAREAFARAQARRG